MATICGANCAGCGFQAQCRGCEATCGRPFGGNCVAAEYILANGKEAYAAFKQGLLAEINGLLTARGIPEAAELYELPGALVNLAYPLPGGATAKFLNDQNVYLGAQIASGEAGVCYGVVADGGLLLISRYGENGANPELICYQKRG